MPRLSGIYSSNILVLVNGHQPIGLVGAVSQFLCLAFILLGHPFICFSNLVKGYYAQPNMNPSSLLKLGGLSIMSSIAAIN
jgi:hypothetical protein